ncbi:hypothetical protein ACGFJC_47510 [Nonomuraea fuscirosea]|uniref:hypothetical protein n=1 Tax=Nonomuraea fuscirosea TaxID=1291556 RepID=UPI003715238B
MNAADELTTPLDQAAAHIREAHERAATLWTSLQTEPHQRNLAGLALVLLHGRDTTATWAQMGVSRTFGDQELLPQAPADKEVLRADWADPAHCDQVIADKKSLLKTLRDDREDAVRERREAIAALVLGKTTGEPVPHAEIATRTGMSLQQINADLKRTRADIPALADMLGLPEARVRGTLDRAREAGIEWPAHDTEPLLFDPVAFRTWWDEHRFGWKTAEQHALDMGVDPARVAELLQVAEEIRDLPEHDDVDGERLFDPVSFRAWWAGRVRDEEDLETGWARGTALAYELRMPVMNLLPLLSKAKKGRRLPEYRQHVRGRQYNVQAVRDFLADRQPDPRFAPVTELADLVDVSEHIVGAWLREAEQRGILPEHTGEGRMRRYDREAFPAWWQETRERTRDGALASLPELAGLLEVTPSQLRAGLAKAEKLGVVLPSPTEGDMFEVAPFLMWWRAWSALGRRKPHFAGLTEVAATLDLPVEKVKRQVKAAVERGKMLPPHRLNERGHREFEVSAYQEWRRIAEG